MFVRSSLAVDRPPTGLSSGAPSRPSTGKPRPAAVPPCPDPELDALHQAYFLTRDLGLRDRLVDQYAGLAHGIAQRVSRGQEVSEDVHQTALLGLIKAVDRFDPGRGLQFSTYAWATINGELKRYFRDHSWALRVPRQLQEAYLQTASAVEELTHELGRSPTIPEIAAHAGVGKEEVVGALEVRAAYRPASLDSTGPDEEGRTLQMGRDEPGLDHVERRQLLSPLLARLPERERLILRLRFVDDLTQSEIATRVGLSQMHVSRLLSRSLAQLRAWATEEPEDTPATQLAN